MANTGITVVAKGTTLAATDTIDGVAATAGASTKAYYKTSGTAGKDAVLFTEYDDAIDSLTLTDAEVLVADDVLVVLKDGSKYTAKDLSDIEEYDDALSKNYVISNFVKYTDDDDTEVALIIYSELD